MHSTQPAYSSNKCGQHLIYTGGGPPNSRRSYPRCPPLTLLGPQTSIAVDVRRNGGWFAGGRLITKIDKAASGGGDCERRPLGMHGTRTNNADRDRTYRINGCWLNHRQRTRVGQQTSNPKQVAWIGISDTGVLTLCAQLCKKGIQDVKSNNKKNLNLFLHRYRICIIEILFTNS